MRPAVTQMRVINDRLFVSFKKSTFKKEECSVTFTKIHRHDIGNNTDSSRNCAFKSYTYRKFIRRPRNAAANLLVEKTAQSRNRRASGTGRRRRMFVVWKLIFSISLRLTKKWSKKALASF